MLFIVGLNHVIATSAARVQVSFELRLFSKCQPLALLHTWRLATVIYISQGTVATFYSGCSYIYNQSIWHFFGIPWTKNY